MGASKIINPATAGGLPPAGVFGTGSINTLAKFTGATTIANSGISDDGATVSFVARNLSSSAAQTWTLATGTSALNIASNLLNLDTTNSRVGIGTASPAFKLHVEGTSTNGVLEVARVSNANAGSGATAELGFRTGATDTQRAYVSCGYGPSDYNLSFGTTIGGVKTETMRLTQGNVGVGTTSPTGRLHVVGGTAAAATNGAPVTIIAQSAGTGNQNGGNIVLTPGALSGIGSAGVADLSGPTGTGLKLPATPGNLDAQTLDCYQDGGATAGGLTWTPTIGGTAANWGGVLPVVASAKYSRIGNLVFCSVSLTGAALVAAYGSTTITGPLAAGPTVNTAVPVSGGGNNGVGVQAGNTVYLPTIAGSTAEIRLNWFYAV